MLGPKTLGPAWDGFIVVPQWVADLMDEVIHEREEVPMITVFERIPDIFVEMYDSQFQQWAREFQKRGQFAAIVFNRPRGAPMLLDAKGEPVWKGAWLSAEIDRSAPSMPRGVIRPRTEHDEEQIVRHCREMLPHVLH